MWPLSDLSTFTNTGSILCKNEHHFDIYDIAFANYFKNAIIKFPDEIKQDIWDWLNKDITIPELIEGLKILLKEYQQYLNIDDLQQFLETLLEKLNKDLEGNLLINAPEDVKSEISTSVDRSRSHRSHQVFSISHPSISQYVMRWLRSRISITLSQLKSGGPYT